MTGRGQLKGYDEGRIALLKSRNPNYSLLSTSKIASYSIQDPRFPGIQSAQTSHRIELVSLWAISPGARILEIGCGQGDCTAVLAEAVGPTGHVDAIDPAPKDYGAPFTLAQAQSHMTASEIGNRIAWHQADPIEFLASNEDKWDFVVLAHCIWYFKSPSTLKTIFDKLKGRASRVCIAEYSLDLDNSCSHAHVIAALAQATLEAHRNSSANIQSLLGPTGIKEIALETEHWELEHESTVRPGQGLDDGRWEVGSVTNTEFLEEIKQDVKNERVVLLLKSMRDLVLSLVDGIGSVKSVHTMDAWAAVFVAPEAKQ